MSDPTDAELAQLAHDAMRSHRERDAAHAARDAAETARDAAEGARDAAEIAGTAAREEMIFLRERVTFLQELVRSTRVYLADVVERDVANLRAEREILVREISVLQEELQCRAAVDDRERAGPAVGVDPGRRSGTLRLVPRGRAWS
jgi:hypothetical protein